MILIKRLLLMQWRYLAPNPIQMICFTKIESVLWVKVNHKDCCHITHETACIASILFIAIPTEFHSTSENKSESSSLLCYKIFMLESTRNHLTIVRSCKTDLIPFTHFSSSSPRDSSKSYWYIFYFIFFWHETNCSLPPKFILVTKKLKSVLAFPCKRLGMAFSFLPLKFLMFLVLSGGCVRYEQNKTHKSALGTIDFPHHVWGHLESLHTNLAAL